jgi:hypothetical protein
MDDPSIWVELLKSGGAITGTSALLLGLWLFVTGRILTVKQHEASVTEAREQHARELADRDAQIARLVDERTQLRAELLRWQFLTVETLDRGERTLDVAGAPSAPPRLAERLIAQ